MMTNPSLKDRHVFWWLCYANVSFGQAEAICPAAERQADLKLQLASGLIATYCRPFKDIKTALGKEFTMIRKALVDKLVPAEFKNLHASMLDLRDKHFCHFDGLDYKDEVFGDINKVFLKKENNALRVVALTIGVNFEAARQLCSTLQNDTHTQIVNLCKQWDMQGLNDGTYELSLNDERMLYIVRPEFLF